MIRWLIFHLIFTPSEKYTAHVFFSLLSFFQENEKNLKHFSFFSYFSKNKKKLKFIYFVKVSDFRRGWKIFRVVYDFTRSFNNEISVTVYLFNCRFVCLYICRYSCVQYSFILFEKKKLFLLCFASY